MEVKVLVLTTEQLIKALGLPKETSILNVKRNCETLDFGFTVENNECPEKLNNAYIVHEFKE